MGRSGLFWPGLPEIDSPTLASPLLAQLADSRLEAAAASGTLVVLYPDLGEPFRSVFSQMIEGIESASRLQVRSIAVAAGMTPNDVGVIVRRAGARAVFA
ncbi:MAG TPA: hypothetical protein VM406_02345, partial [Noviherbaspirillum sp.]|nr:hypothetical protein [Noviherbaspirillum sp.]